MLAVPMTTPGERTIGVLQLINRKQRRMPEGGGTGLLRMAVVPFDTENEEVALSLASGRRGRREPAADREHPAPL